MKMKFEIVIGDRSTKVIVDTKKENCFGFLPEQFNGGYHNEYGIIGYAVESAVRKIFGQSAYWHGDHDNKLYGQVFRPIGRSNPGVSTSLTGKTYVYVNEIWRK